jgi:hypothetical protein
MVNLLVERDPICTMLPSRRDPIDLFVSGSTKENPVTRTLGAAWEETEPRNKRRKLNKRRKGKKPTLAIPVNDSYNSKLLW